MNELSVPRRARGRQNSESLTRYEQDREAFCERILQINSSLDFRVSSRGWCYLLEEFGLPKGDFDLAQKFINDCRRDGFLPLDICADDEARQPDGLPKYTNGQSPEEYATMLAERLSDFAYSYRPRDFWEDRGVYVEMLVEKIDLKGVFGRVCSEYFVPIANARGWADLNSRGGIIRRFREQSYAGNRCVLLYCGDHDPGGLTISSTMRENLMQLERAAGTLPDIEIVRFGLNYDFIQSQGLTWIDNLETGSGKRLDDPSHNDFPKPYVQNYLREFGARKVEANALVTRIEAGRQMCREAIEQFVNLDDVREYQQHLSTMRQEVVDALPAAVAQAWRIEP